MNLEEEIEKAIEQFDRDLEEYEKGLGGCIIERIDESGKS